MKKNNKGFTLVELMIVIVIIGILAAILIPTISGAIEDARVTEAVANAKSAFTAYSTAAVQTEDMDLVETCFEDKNGYYVIIDVNGNPGEATKTEPVYTAKLQYVNDVLTLTISESGTDTTYTIDASGEWKNSTP